MKLLLVEDDLALHKSLAKLLKKSGMVVDSAYDGQEGLDFLDYSSYDLAIVDVMMPVLDGFGFLETIRQKGLDLPVIFLTAKGGLEDRIKGLDLGADDYMVKPFEFEELLARIHAVLRRHDKRVASPLFRYHDLVVDLEKKRLFRLEEEVDLTSKELNLLAYLIRNQGLILSRQQIRDHLWDSDYEGSSNMIDVLVKNIRRKTQEADIIRTKRGLGYYVEKE